MCFLFFYSGARPLICLVQSGSPSPLLEPIICFGFVVYSFCSSSFSLFAGPKCQKRLNRLLLHRVNWNAVPRLRNETTTDADVDEEGDMEPTPTITGEPNGCALVWQVCYRRNAAFVVIYPVVLFPGFFVLFALLASPSLLLLAGAQNQAVFDYGNRV